MTTAVTSDDEYGALVDASEHARENDRRDTFAMHALVGLLAADAMVQPRTRDFLHNEADCAATRAFDLADAMLRESDKRRKP